MRFNKATVDLKWAERSFFQKLLFWKKYTKQIFVEVKPDDPAYEKAEYEEVTLLGKDPFAFMYIINE